MGPTLACSLSSNCPDQSVDEVLKRDIHYMVRATGASLDDMGIITLKRVLHSYPDYLVPGKRKLGTTPHILHNQQRI